MPRTKFKMPERLGVEHLVPGGLETPFPRSGTKGFKYPWSPLRRKFNIKDPKARHIQIAVNFAIEHPQVISETIARKFKITKDDLFKGMASHLHRIGKI